MPEIIGVLRGEANYEKCRNYWKYLKKQAQKRKQSVG